MISPLFHGRKIITKRVAIGCFIIHINDVKIQLSEHSKFKLVPIVKLKTLKLTPESKKIIAKYVNL